MKEEYRPNIHMVDNALVRDYNKNVETQTVATTYKLHQAEGSALKPQ